MTEQYVEFHAASAFSFLEGASLPEDLIQRAAELHMPAMALLDRNGVYGSARFHTLARKQGVRAHIGAEIAVSSLAGGLLLRHGCHISMPRNLLVCRCYVLHAPDIKIFAN